MYRHPSLRAALLAGVVLSFAGAAHGAEADAADGGGEVSTVYVQGQDEKTAAAGLDLPIKATPQSVSVIDRQQIEDFALTNVNDLLRLATGVSVEQVETNRTYYTARGFDITSFQVDGTGVPFQFGLLSGDMDTAFYDRVEVVRGADGLLTGAGNPSATINYIRKRPTQTFAASLEASAGSWDRARLQADVSGPLNASGTVLGRLVVLGQDEDSWLDRYHATKTGLYGVLEARLSSKAAVSLGYQRQDNHATGILWGALPLSYGDGTQASWPVSTNTSANWTYWDTKRQTGFAELRYDLSGDWTFKASVTASADDEPSKLFYVYGAPDPVTGLGLYGWPLRYVGSNHSVIADASISGSYSLFGRPSELTAGVSASRSRTTETSFNASDGFDAIPPLGQWNGVMAQPHFDAPTTGGRFTDRLTRAYVATRLNLSDPFKLVVGLNALGDKAWGLDYGADMAKDVSKVSPYVGAVFDLNDNVTLYASYSDIFRPQNEIDVTGQTLDPAKGSSYEAGLKSDWLDGRLFVNLAAFKSEQKGLAEYAGAFPDGRSYYAGTDALSQGWEIEAGARPVEGLTLQGGFTHLSIKDVAGAASRLYTPRNQGNLSATYSPPTLPALTLGATLRWQDDISTDTGYGIARQKAYSVVGLMGRYALNDRLSVQLNVENAGDTKYLNSLYWTQAWYGQPRSAFLTLKWAY